MPQGSMLVTKIQNKFPDDAFWCMESNSGGQIRRTISQTSPSALKFCLPLIHNKRGTKIKGVN